MSDIVIRRREKKKDGDADGVVTATRALAPQMASSQIFLVKGEIDERKMAVLNELQQAALGHFNYRAEVDDIRYYKKIIEWDLTSSQGIGGLARRQNIQMVSAAAGGGKGALDVADRPNIIARNVTNRNWKEKATREGKVVVE